MIQFILKVSYNHLANVFNSSKNIHSLMFFYFQDFHFVEHVAAVAIHLKQFWSDQPFSPFIFYVHLFWFDLLPLYPKLQWLTLLYAIFYLTYWEWFERYLRVSLQPFIYVFIIISSHSCLLYRYNVEMQKLKRRSMRRLTSSSVG